MTTSIDNVNAPRDHGDATILPSAANVSTAARRNRELLSSYAFTIGDQTHAKLSKQARRELVAAAVEHTSRYRNVSPTLLDATAQENLPAIVLAGHQPQLFHPGVWFKNFALARTAVALDAIPININVDNDAAGSGTVRVPGGSPRNPFLESVAYHDKPAADLPFEEWQFEDLALANAFANNVQSVIGSLVPNPLIHEFWPLVLNATERSKNVGRCIAEARHQYELKCGIETLEVTMSKIADGDAFRVFFAGVLQDHQRFHEVYNEELLRYRGDFRVRSATHPVPVLESVDDWYELPFWVWRTESPHRRKLFARRRGDEFELTDRVDWTERCDRHGRGLGKTGENRSEGGLGWGVKLRPRALMTTMYARLLLTDWFIHGVGGAKYDRLTDRIIQKYWGVRAPEYAAISATFHLPVSVSTASLADYRRAVQELRNLRFHPECSVDSQRADIGQLVEEKAKWIALQLPRGERKERHNNISELNERLFSHLQNESEELQIRVEQMSSELRLAAILKSREYSFCLHPMETLFPLLLELFDFEP